jgi:hypothetical protein
MQENRALLSDLICQIECDHLQAAFDSLPSTGSRDRDNVVAAELEPLKSFCRRITQSSPENGYDLGRFSGYSDSFFRNVAHSVLVNYFRRELCASNYDSATAADTLARRCLGGLGANSVTERLRSVSCVFNVLANMLNATIHMHQPSLCDLTDVRLSNALDTDLRSIATMEPTLGFLCEFTIPILHEFFQATDVRKRTLSGCCYDYLSSLDEVTTDAVKRMAVTLRTISVSTPTPVVVPAFKTIFFKATTQVVRVPDTIHKLGLTADYVASNMQTWPCGRGVVEEIMRQLKQFYAARSAQASANDDLKEARVLQGTCFAAQVWLTAAAGQMVVLAPDLWDNDNEEEEVGHYLPDLTDQQALEERRWIGVYSHVERRLAEDMQPLIAAAKASTGSAKADMRADVWILDLIARRLALLISALRSGDETDLAEFVIPPTPQNVKATGISERALYIGTDMLVAAEARQQGQWAKDTSGVRFTTSAQTLRLFNQDERRRHVSLHASMQRKIGEMLARIHHQRQFPGLECKPLAFMAGAEGLRKVTAALVWAESNAQALDEVYLGALWPVKVLANSRSQPRGSRWRDEYDRWRAWRGQKAGKRKSPPMLLSAPSEPACPPHQSSKLKRVKKPAYGI